jgi:hypothetical protein
MLIDMHQILHVNFTNHVKLVVQDENFGFETMKVMKENHIIKIIHQRKNKYNTKSDILELSPSLNFETIVNKVQHV